MVLQKKPFEKYRLFSKNKQIDSNIMNDLSRQQHEKQMKEKEMQLKREEMKSKEKIASKRPKGK